MARIPFANTSTLDVLTDNITKTIRKAKRSGTIGMSYGNLKQITPTTGLTCHPAEYHRLFPQIADVVSHNLKFPLYH